MSCNQCGAKTSRRLCSQCELAEREETPIAPDVFDDDGDDDE